MFFSFSLNKKTSTTLLLALMLLSISLPLLQAKPHSSFRVLQETDGGDDGGNTDDTDSDSDNGNNSLGKGCWIESYGRGVGKPVSVCPNGLVNDASLCYTPCSSGYTGAGPVCWQNCPSGFTDTGADCLKPQAYGRGTGYAAWHESECNKDHSQGCEKCLAMWYPKCADGFHPAGCNICSPNCIDGMTDIGVSCQKQSYGRGVGKPLVCTSSQDEDAGLCYNQCKAGYSGNGPVCWGNCPAGMYQCGALCLESESQCVADMLQIADQVLSAMSDAYGEDDYVNQMMTVGQTGVNIGEELAKLPMCSNM